MVLNRKTLLKHRNLFREVYECSSTRKVKAVLAKASISSLKCLLALFVDVIRKKIPVDNDVIKKKMKRYERHLRHLAIHFNLFRKMDDP